MLVKIKKLNCEGFPKDDFQRIIVSFLKAIRSVTINEKKKVVTVVFLNGDVQMAKCQPEDNFDSKIGIALCMAYHVFGSKNKFNKYVGGLK